MESSELAQTTAKELAAHVSLCAQRSLWGLGIIAAAMGGLVVQYARLSSTVGAIEARQMIVISTMHDVDDRMKVLSAKMEEHDSRLDDRLRDVETKARK